MSYEHFYRIQRISEMLFLIRDDDDDDLTFVRKLFSHVKLHKSFSLAFFRFGVVHK